MSTTATAKPKTRKLGSYFSVCSFSFLSAWNNIMGDRICCSCRGDPELIELSSQRSDRARIRGQNSHQRRISSSIAVTSFQTCGLQLCKKRTAVDGAETVYVQGVAIPIRMTFCTARYYYPTPTTTARSLLPYGMCAIIHCLLPYLV